MVDPSSSSHRDLPQEEEERRLGSQPLLLLCAGELQNEGKWFRRSSRMKTRQNKSDQLSCDFMASCTDIHVLLCTVSLITSFQKDRQRNEWVVKHAHKNIIACLGAFVSCL